MPNPLIHSNSPYLLQHAHNPVDWQPWGDEAFAQARELDRPVFLSIGYAACHWCHVMAHESFEDTKIAAFMNAHFVNVKVDREERPDVDHIYINAVTALTGQGGWPLSVFLTPAGQPFYGGTYFPPQRRYNLPSFFEVLTSIARVWEKDRQRIYAIGEQITSHLNSTSELVAPQPGEEPSEATLLAALAELTREYDWEHGGWGRAPRFPQPMAIEFLLRRALRNGAKGEGDPSLRMATHALRSMARGGMYDLLGGGFARYSTDDEWRVPHFEKMLYDNALLARVYLHAHLITGDLLFKQVAGATLDFIAKELTHPLGGFYSSLDADSEGEEGKYYLWTRREIDSVLEEGERKAFYSAYRVPEDMDEPFVLQRRAPEPTSEVLISPVDWDALHARLLAQRAERIGPGLDDKVLVVWNVLVDLVLLDFCRYFGGDVWLNMAIRNLTFIFEYLYQDGALSRSWRGGQTGPPAFLEDYAGLTLASLALYQVCHQAIWFQRALSLANQMIERFSAPSGGFYDVEERHGQLVSRPMSLEDNATPCGNSLAAQALLELHALTGDHTWKERADAALRKVTSLAARYPLAFANWLAALDFSLGEVVEVALLGETDQLKPFEQVLWSTYRPNLVLAAGQTPIPDEAPGLLKGRPQVDNQPTAYVCRNFTCLLPVTTPEAFLQALGDAS
ncbi:MAG: thioredoxin domain-containing protein [Anaerolineales bacterium]|nr:thioredoxin domain-containing protein [Anaerolineales bacterium]